MRVGFFKKIILLLGILSLSSCTIDNRHVEQKYDDYQNADIVTWSDYISDVTTWDNVSIHTFDESDEVCSSVYSQLLFDGISSEFASVTAIEMDYRSNGKYFNGDLVYELVGNKFDLNPLITKFAIGTGVIIVCVVISVATYGAGTPVACFFAGAAEGAIQGALIGTAMGGATAAVTSYIKSNGDWEKTLYGTVDGATSGYMWGAIFGAVTGGLNSKMCFAAETPVLTSNGYKAISDITNNDFVYSYNESDKKFTYDKVLSKYVNFTDSLIVINTENDVIKTTKSHPFLSVEGWKSASDLRAGDLIASDNNKFVKIRSVDLKKCDSTPVYNLSVDHNHTYVIGNDKMIVHNVCAKDFSGDTYKFPEGSPQAAKYPNGINVDANGFPRFERYAEKVVKLPYPSIEGKANGTCLIGNDYADFKLANKMAGFSKTPARYTWHHVEDMQTMLLVPQDIHSFMFGGLRHQGGASLIRMFFQMLMG